MAQRRKRCARLAAVLAAVERPGRHLAGQARLPAPRRPRRAHRLRGGAAGQGGGELLMAAWHHGHAAHARAAGAWRHFPVGQSARVSVLGARAGHLRHFSTFSIIKSDFFLHFF